MRHPDTGSIAFPLSVILLTLNEEINIEACLGGVAWADDIILVDSLSTDTTIERARRARPDVRVFTHPFRDFGDQRTWALDNTAPKHDWVLFLDADERCTPACAEAIRDAVRNPGQSVGFFLANRYIFMDRWIRHCTLYPSWQLRLLKLGRVRFRKEGHGQREVTDGPLGYVREPYDHYGFSKGVGEWKARHDTYSTNEVDLLLRLRTEPIDWRTLGGSDAVARRRALKQIASRLPGRPWVRFLYMYALRGGFLDGRPGLEFCRLRLWHERRLAAKVAEARRQMNKRNHDHGAS